jgi:hypothetical protein
VRLLITVAFALASTACGAPLVQNLPLEWTLGKPAPAPSPSVSHALASVPISFGLRDVRPDPTAVGQDERTGHIVRTTDVVGQYASTQVGEMLRAAGARLDEAPAAVIEADLTEFNVVEGGSFKAAVGFRVTVSHGGVPVWSRGVRGTASTWGRTHSPANFNKALSGALHEATGQLLQDEAFATALMGGGAPAAPPSGTPVAPPSAAPVGPAGQ